MAEEIQQTRMRLGRGLAALIGDAAEEGAPDRRGTRRVPIEYLRPNPRNPRTNFPDEALDELAESIRERGILQPIIVRQVSGGSSESLEIIAGERRWRAAQRAALHEVPVILVEADDRQALEIAIIENVQRTDLNALEEAIGYNGLTDSFGYNQGEIAKVVGKSRSHVANTLRLLALPEGIKDKLRAGLLSAGHARALLSAADPDGLAVRIVREGLSVREAERLSQAAPEIKQRDPRDKDIDTLALEKALSDVVGLEVTISHKTMGGSLAIRYGTLEQLDGLCKRLQQSPANNSL